MSTPTLVNKVAQSDLHVIDLELFLPEKPLIPFDLKPFLVQEMVLMEKPFRAALQNITLEPYRQEQVAVFCSVDTLIPHWAWMLVAAKLHPVVAGLWMGTPESAAEALTLSKVAAFDVSPFQGRKVILKGCSDREIPAAVYLAMAQRLLPLVQSLMYGEPCSSVPVYKATSEGKGVHA